MKAKVKKPQVVCIPNCSIIQRKLSACKKLLTKKEMEAINALIYFLNMKGVCKHMNIKQRECDKLLRSALKKLEKIYGVKTENFDLSVRL